MLARAALSAALALSASVSGCATLEGDRNVRFFGTGESLVRVSRPEYLDVTPGYCTVRVERRAYRAVLSVSYEHARMSDVECDAQAQAFDQGVRPAVAQIRCEFQDAPNCFGTLAGIRLAIESAGTDPNVRVGGSGQSTEQNLMAARSFLRLGRFFVYAPVEGEGWWCARVSEQGFDLGDFGVQVCRESRGRGEDYQTAIYVTPRYVH